MSFYTEIGNTLVESFPFGWQNKPNLPLGNYNNARESIKAKSNYGRH